MVLAACSSGTVSQESSRDIDPTDTSAAAGDGTSGADTSDGGSARGGRSSTSATGGNDTDADTGGADSAAGSLGVAEGEAFTFDVPAFNKVSVVGVADQGLLDVHEHPSRDAGVIETLASMDTSAGLTGQGIYKDGDLWRQVQGEGFVGWVQQYVAFLGPPVNSSDTLRSAVGSSELFGSGLELVDATVAAFLEAEGGSADSLYVLAEVGAISEQFTQTFTVDVLTEDSDVQVGHRLIIVSQVEADEGSSAGAGDAGSGSDSAADADSGSEGVGQTYRLVVVQQFPLCLFGVSADGTCSMAAAR